MRAFWLSLAAAGAALTTTAAQATIYTFDMIYWEGGGPAPTDSPDYYTAHFTVDDAFGGETSNGFWSYADGHIFDFPLFDGSSSHADIDFYNASALGGLTLIPYINTPDGLDVDFSFEIDPVGPALFTDDGFGGHHLQPGTYTLLWYGGDASDGQFRLTISEAGAGAVPEPAAWTMMIGGFGMVGAAMRQRKRAAVRFA